MSEIKNGKRKSTCFGLIGNVVDYDDPVNSRKFDDSLVEKQFFTPQKESVRRLLATPSAVKGVQQYDFDDGVDDGRSLPITRYEGVDRAEVSQYEMTLCQHIDETAYNDALRAGEVVASELSARVNQAVENRSGDNSSA